MKKLLVLLLSVPLWGQGVRYENNVWTAATNVPAGAQAPILTIPNSQIAVCASPANASPCTNLVQIFADAALTVPVANPLTADSLGRFGFYVASGNYVYSILDGNGGSSGDIPITVFGPNATGINASLLPGADVGAQIQAADTLLGSSSGDIFVSINGTISTPVTLQAGRSLRFLAPVTFAASVAMGNSSSVSCSSPASVLSTTTAGLILFNVSSKTHVTFKGCTVTSTQPSAFFVGNSGASVGTGFIDIDHNSVTGLSALTTAGTLNNNFTITGNSVQNSTAVAAFTLLNTIGATATGNHFTNDVHGIEWWGGDSNGGYTGPSSDTLTGNLALNDNTCKSMTNACIWGSMGFDISIVGNTAVGCGDTCFDPEGSIRVVVEGNAADCTGGNFCYSSFFGSEDLRFSHNIGTRNDSGTIAILKYNAGNQGPRHQNAVFDSNTFGCTLASTLCTAFYTEGDSNIHITNNVIVNGTIQFTGFHTAETISGNHLKYDFVPSSAFTSIDLRAPILGENWLRFHDNVVELVKSPTTGFAQFAGGTVGVWVAYEDFNNSDYFEVKNNEFIGFPSPIVTNNGGGNIGPTAYPHMFTYISGNHLDHGAITHTSSLYTETNTGVCTVNCTATYIEDNYFLYGDNRKYDGTFAPSNINQTVSGTSTATAASVGATSALALTWPMAFNDTSYIPVCSVTAISGAPQILNLSSLSTTGITVTVQATTAVAASGTVSCTGKHL